uniref:dihydrofolate reductase n=1 Tax=viral metagenome TaxID=1070528 RepID=A0A6C0II40_9ZZZZ
MEAIVALDLNNGISKNGVIPWNSKKDMIHFYKKTIGNIVIMGKNTYFSIPEERRPLKNRLNVVLTTHPQLYQDISNSAVIFTNDDSIHIDILNSQEKYRNVYPFLHENFKVFLIGGKQIYEKLIPYCHTIWLTQIKKDYNCDLFLKNAYNFNNKMMVTEIENDDELVIYKYERF